MPQQGPPRESGKKFAFPGSGGFSRSPPSPREKLHLKPSTQARSRNLRCRLPRGVWGKLLTLLPHGAKAKGFLCSLTGPGQEPSLQPDWVLRVKASGAERKKGSQDLACS